MKIYLTIIPKSWIPRTAKICTACAVLATLSACVSVRSFFHTTDSQLPIEVHQSGNGHILSFRAHQTSDRLYVAGSAKKQKLSFNAHVDIQLIGPSGEVIAKDKNEINPMGSAPGGGKRYTDSYVVSFPLSQARKAVKIRVLYHSKTHSNFQ